MQGVIVPNPCRTPGVSCTAGFTLLELAVTLAIVGVLAAGILVPFVAQVAQRNVAATERILEQARETLLGFAIANGRLPCPATDTSNGQESPTPPAASGACTSYYGFLPAATLGFTPIDSQGYAIDGWATTQNRIRYAVSDFRDGGNLVFTRAGGMKAAGPAGLGGVTFLYVCGSGASSTNPGLHCGPGAPGSGGSTVLTSTAPAVIWSLGTNAATGGGTSVDEAQNQFPGALAGGGIDRIFVSRTMNNTPGAEFDDIVTWLSVGNLVSRMVMAGQLP